nr:ATP-binding cassette domain-containing protein [Variovorax sp. E3]
MAAHFPEATHARLGAWMEEIGLSPGLLDTDIPRLSTGERQRLALLRSLAREPAVLLLDEPTASLDAESTLVIEALLARRLAQGLTILMVTHSREQAARIGHRRFDMADGQLREAA